MKLTIRDVAKMAGVSPGTVSKVMNGTGSISVKTIKRVEKIIEETGYQPSFFAKSLATQKSNLIGLIYTGDVQAKINHPVFNEVVNVFKERIGRLGYDILMFSNSKSPKEHQSYLARCKHYQVDGCLIISGNQAAKEIHELDQSEVPCAGIDIKLTGLFSSYVMTDNEQVSTKVVEYFHSKNISQIAFIGGPKGSMISDVRRNAFIKKMNHFNMNIKPDWLQYGNYSEESGYTITKQILENQPLPEAIFAASDTMALGALKALNKAGISVPRQMKVVGCDDIEACKYSQPPLATVKQDKEEIGRMAAEMLHKLIKDQQPKQPKLVEPEIIIRESAQIK